MVENKKTKREIVEPKPKKKVYKDSPLAELTLRKYEKPFKGRKRELIKKLCLSVGLLQPGDSRDVIVDVLFVFIQNKKKELTSKEVEKKVVQNRKKYKLARHGIAGSNIRRQIKRLRDLFIVEKIKNNYRITENSKLCEIFDEKIEKYYLNSILNRVREYFDAVDP